MGCMESFVSHCPVWPSLSTLSQTGSPEHEKSTASTIRNPLANSNWAMIKRTFLMGVNSWDFRVFIFWIFLSSSGPNVKRKVKTRPWDRVCNGLIHPHTTTTRQLFLAPTGAQEVALPVCLSVCVSLLWILHSILMLSSSSLQGLFRVSSGSLQGLFRVS